MTSSAAARQPLADPCSLAYDRLDVIHAIATTGEIIATVLLGIWASAPLVASSRR